jgi:hypothetical protein
MNYKYEGWEFYNSDQVRSEYIKSKNYTIQTPLGELADWQIYDLHNIGEYNYPNYGDVYGDRVIESIVSYRLHIDAVYSSKAIAQLFSIEALKSKTHFPCGNIGYSDLWVPTGGPCYSDNEVYESACDFSILASADLVNGENTDPRIQSSNTFLEAAIAQLKSQFEAIAASPPEGSLLNYGFTLELRE